MTELVLDVRRGATAEALLGALVEAGASVEAIDAAVGTLGRGDVRLQVQAAPAGSSVRIRAPRGAPTNETWGELRPRMALLALDEAIVERALAVLDLLFGARAAVHGVAPDEVDVDPFSGPDDLANAVALAAATTSLGPLERISASTIGHGTGMMRSIEGDVLLPGPVVGHLLADRATTELDHAREVVDAVGAAYLAAITESGAEVGDAAPTENAPRGRGRLPNGATVVAWVVSRAATPEPAARA